MTRDMELIRAILVSLDKHEHGFAPPQFDLPGYSREQIDFHIHLLGQAGLMEVVNNTTLVAGSPSALPISITWQGYEFLDASRNDTIWKKATTLPRMHVHEGRRHNDGKLKATRRE